MSGISSPIYSHAGNRSGLKRDGISNTAISEAIKRCKAQKVFVMIDACKSGKLILAMRSTEARKALVQLARSTGTYIISASTDRRYAAELKDLGHGVFTYTLLEGLQGKGGEKKVHGGGAHPLCQRIVCRNSRRNTGVRPSTP